MPTFHDPITGESLRVPRLPRYTQDSKDSKDSHPPAPRLRDILRRKRSTTCAAAPHSQPRSLSSAIEGSPTSSFLPPRPSWETGSVSASPALRHPSVRLTTSAPRTELAQSSPSPTQSIQNLPLQSPPPLMASGPFVWGPSPGVPIWMPYSPYAQNPSLYAQSPYGSPYTSPYPSPYASPLGVAPSLYTPSPFFPTQGLWPGTPFASPYAQLSPGLAAPYTPGLATPYTTTALPAAPSPGAASTMLPPDGTPPTTPPVLQPVHVAPWLTYNPLDPRPAIRWDVASEPSNAKQWSSKLWRFAPLAPQFEERATYPGAEEKVLIVVDGVDTVQEVYGAIEVPIADPSLGDVLKAVHEFFQKRMNKDEVEKVKAMKEGNWERMIQAMADRCRRAPGLPEYEWSQGLRRVDLLGEKTAWGGLQVEYTAEGGWQLRLMLTTVEAE